MIKVITYGTYDLLHYGHIRLLERAKALGDYLIVGVTSDDYDKVRGKINNRQSLIERIEAVKSTGLADEVIVEEYDGQKIDDIKKYGIDIFTLGSDWEGKFDYLKQYCKVIYLPRTEGISSSKIRAEDINTRIAVISDNKSSGKFIEESRFVNGVEADYAENLKEYDLLYVAASPEDRYNYVKNALSANKSVLCESPITLSVKEANELYELAEKNNLFLMTAIKTAFLTGFKRMLLLVKSGKIGEIVSVDATCTSIRNGKKSLYSWGSIAMLPIFELLGTNYKSKKIISKMNDDGNVDIFTKIDFVFQNAVASIKVANAAKSEGELVITGTKGYVYVPAPWWKTDYFEVRYENQSENKRCFYQIDGEGIRYEIAEFVNHVNKGYHFGSISKEISVAITKIMEDYRKGTDVVKI